MRTRVLIADDHELVSKGIERILENEFDVVGIVSDGRELLAEASRSQPDVIILDIAMPLLNGIEAASRLHNSLPNTKLLFVTQQVDRHYVQAAFHAGGHGYVLKQSAAGEVREAAKAVLAGRFYISPALAKDLPPIAELRTNPAELFPGNLTPREREVLQLVAQSAPVVVTALTKAQRIVGNRRQISRWCRFRPVAQALQLSPQPPA